LVQAKFPVRLVTFVVLALVFGVALYFRIAPFHDQVFSGEWIKFTGVDGYYHMRLVDSLLEHFPRFLSFDPYTFFPHGHHVDWPPFFEWFLGGVVLLFGLGSPTERLIDTVGVYFPPVLGSLTVIPVYFIGSKVFNRGVGLLAAGLIAILPGQIADDNIWVYAFHQLHRLSVGREKSVLQNVMLNHFVYNSLGYYVSGDWIGFDVDIQPHTGRHYFHYF